VLGRLATAGGTEPLSAATIRALTPAIRVNSADSSASFTFVAASS
jgi:hypothetical protein